MSTPNPATARIRNTGDLLAAVPYLLGFAPEESIVIVALTGTKVTFAARADLATANDTANDTADAGTAAERLAVVVARQRPTTTMVIGYGPAEVVIPALATTTAMLGKFAVGVAETLRVTDGRYFHDNCTDPSHPADGTPLDPDSSPLPAYAIYYGCVALPDRDALAAQLAPASGPDRDAMHQATARAARRLAALLRPHPTGTDHTDTTAPEPHVSPAQARDALHLLGEAGKTAVDQALGRCQAGGRLTDDEAAWLSLLLRHIPTRDYAWTRIDGADEHQQLWTDLTRRAMPDLAAAPASLLAFAAFRAGQGALANIAVERALDSDREYPMALLVALALEHGLPPSALDGWPDAVDEPSSTEV